MQQTKTWAYQLCTLASQQRANAQACLPKYFAQPITARRSVCSHQEPLTYPTCVQSRAKLEPCVALACAVLAVIHALDWVPCERGAVARGWLQHLHQRARHYYVLCQPVSVPACFTLLQLRSPLDLRPAAFRVCRYMSANAGSAALAYLQDSEGFGWMLQLANIVCGSNNIRWRQVRQGHDQHGITQGAQ